MKKKSVVIDGSSLIYKRGSSTYVNSLIVGLTKIKYSKNFFFIVIVPSNFKPTIKSKNNLIFLKRPYINKIIWDLLLLPIYCWLEGGKLLHSTENTCGSLLSKIFGFKNLLTVHDVSYLKSFNLVGKPKLLKQWIGLFYRRVFVRSSVKNAQTVITVSNFAKSDIINELNIHPKKIKVIYNSISSEFFSNTSISKKKQILIVTGKSNQKNLEKTLKFLRNCKDILKEWKVIIIGVSGRSSSYIKFKGEIDRSNLVSHYDKASILLMPSLYESFSLPLIEGLSRNVFVISSNRGAAPEILKNYGLLYDPTSFKEFREVLFKITKNLKLLKNFNFKIGRMHAFSFTEEKLAMNTYKIYKKLI